jgi:acetyltransferase-like isoleucine patch superfamily enzyme
MISQFLSELRLYVCNRFVSQIPCHTLRLAFYRRAMGFEIGVGSAILMDAWFDAARNLSIGRNSIVNQNCRLDTRGGVHIGDNVIVAADCIVLTADHDPNDTSRAHGRLAAVSIENYVCVGTRAMILRGVTLHHGCVVAAGCVVTKDVNAFEIVAGVPARVIGRRPEALSYTPSYQRLLW